MFFNRVWEKKRESEAAYVEHVATLSSDTLPRKKHDPLPEVPPSPSDRTANRNRSMSERHYESPTLVTREIHSSSSSLVARPAPFEVSLVDDDGLSPYAVVKRTTFPTGFNQNQQPFTSTPNASSTEEVNPYASSTPLRAEDASSTEEVNPYASSIPLRAEVRLSVYLGLFIRRP